MERALTQRQLVAVFAGGMAGALLRTWLTRELPDTGGSFPWTVLAVNLAGAAILGGVVGYLRSPPPQPGAPRRSSLRPLVGTGFCGALTTFSTFQLELLELVRDHRIGLAVAYAAASLGAGYVLVSIALVAGQRAGRPADFEEPM